MNRDQYSIRQRELSARGEDLPQAKLTEQQVREARKIRERAQFARRWIDEHYSVSGLAKKYGVSTGAMEKVLNYTTWRHVK